MAESPLEGDEIIEKNGLKVYIDPYTSKMLSGMELDYVDNGMVAGFVLKGGNPGSSCGSNSCSTC
ncbi:MAG: hypothetical protein GXO99_07840 [Nitrospirae bacterium]|nr:hypothetical protein [Nitrospirota bacterium]